MMMRFFRITGMIEDLLPDCFRQVRELIIRTATASRRAAATRWCILTLPEYFEFNHGFPPDPVPHGTRFFAVKMADASGVPKMGRMT
jgi:hypothetical protein